MSDLSARDIWICDQCGAVVWWQHKEQHGKWHERLEEQNREVPE